jgi:hypothetical protein
LHFKSYQIAIPIPLATISTLHTLHQYCKGGGMGGAVEW